MSAQTLNTGIAGEYYLRGVMETASGFKLDTDSSFQFFFSYGALDRFGQGNWSIKNGNVILNSRPRPPQDFSILNSKMVKDDFITIHLKEENPIFLSALYCVIHSGGKQVEQVSNKQGSIKFPKQQVDSITLIFKFCPERSSVFSIINPTHNYFEFSLQPSIMEVFLKILCFIPGRQY